MLTIILASALIIALAALVLILLGKNKSGLSAEAARLAEEERRHAFELQREISEVQRRQYEEASQRLLDEARRQYEQQISELNHRLEQQASDLQRLASIQFENLSNKALQRQADKLSEENLSGLTSLLSPLRENLGDFQRAVNDSYVKENASREALSRQIDSLIKANAEIGSETRRLSEALRGNARFQGKWGETILQNLLETAGFINGIHYKAQVTELDGKPLTDDEKNPLRPDLIFFIPDGARIVIDAKTSMTAYLRYCDAEDEKTEKEQLSDHILSIRKHIDKLGKTRYHKHIKGALEHTLMFMPNDGAYIAALRADSKISEYAQSKNVVIVSPAHLLSILSLVSQLWRIDNQNKNADKIANLGGLLYDKIASFISEFDSIAKNIENAQKAYQHSRQLLTDGTQSVIARANRLKSLGAKTSRSLPQDYSENDGTIL